jgi:hypothetical protein
MLTVAEFRALQAQIRENPKRKATAVEFRGASSAWAGPEASRDASLLVARPARVFVTRRLCGARRRAAGCL